MIMDFFSFASKHPDWSANKIIIEYRKRGGKIRRQTALQQIRNIRNVKINKKKITRTKNKNQIRNIRNVKINKKKITRTKKSIVSAKNKKRMVNWEYRNFDLYIIYKFINIKYLSQYELEHLDLMEDYLKRQQHIYTFGIKNRFDLRRADAFYDELVLEMQDAEISRLDVEYMKFDKKGKGKKITRAKLISLIE
jgi:hypothetical protein